jgi:hypothetical protein
VQGWRDAEDPRPARECCWCRRTGVLERGPRYRARCTLYFRHVSRDALDSAGLAGALPQPGVTRVLTSPIVLHPEPETVFHRGSRPSVSVRGPESPDHRVRWTHLRQDTCASVWVHDTGNELEFEPGLPVSFLGTFLPGFLYASGGESRARASEDGGAVRLGIPGAPGVVGPACREGWEQVNSDVGPTYGRVHVKL